MKLGRLVLPLAAASAVALMAGMSEADAQEIATYKVSDYAIKEPLTATPGDPKNGRKLVAGQRKGNCLACHKMPIPEEQFHGLVGPELNGVGSRLSEGELRLRIADAKQVNPDTSMPAFHRVAGLHRVATAHQEKPILTAQEVEDVVAYLLTLKQ